MAAVFTIYDVVLFATDPAEATDMLAEFEEACGRAGLKINVKKTQYMATKEAPPGHGDTRAYPPGKGGLVRISWTCYLLH